LKKILAKFSQRSNDEILLTLQIKLDYDTETYFYEGFFNKQQQRSYSFSNIPSQINSLITHKLYAKYENDKNTITFYYEGEEINSVYIIPKKNLYNKLKIFEKYKKNYYFFWEKSSAEEFKNWLKYIQQNKNHISSFYSNSKSITSYLQTVAKKFKKINTIFTTQDTNTQPEAKICTTLVNCNEEDLTQMDILWQELAKTLGELPHST
jgi:transcription-repair coupling factor (superfamily II helicase)